MDQKIMVHPHNGMIFAIKKNELLFIVTTQRISILSETLQPDPILPAKKVYIVLLYINLKKMQANLQQQSTGEWLGMGWRSYIVQRRIIKECEKIFKVDICIWSYHLECGDGIMDVYTLKFTKFYPTKTYCQFYVNYTSNSYLKKKKDKTLSYYAHIFYLRLTVS